MTIFFTHGFRPFFLGAGVHAVLAMGFWLTWIAVHAAGGALTWISIAGPPHLWHAHEMVFGYAVAAVSGFLLTAVPNWTGAMPLAGRPLAILFAIWVAGRFAMLASAFVPASVVAAVDLALVPMLGLHIARQLLVKPQMRNFVFLALLAGLFLANAWHHLVAAGVLDVDPAAGVRAGVLVLVMLVVIIGGRIVPAFTENYMRRVAPRVPGPVRSALIDRIALATTSIFAAVAVVPAGHGIVGIAALAACLANGVRLGFWRGTRVMGEPIVAVLHVGYLWVVIGLALWAEAALNGIFSEVSALHALAVGGIGTLTLAVMSRASLGHTGRPLVAPGSIAVAYALVSVAAALRVLGPVIAPSSYNTVMLASGLAWFAAFALFVAFFAPVLSRPRPGADGADA